MDTPPPTDTPSMDRVPGDAPSDSGAPDVATTDRPTQEAAVDASVDVRDAAVDAPTIPDAVRASVEAYCTLRTRAFCEGGVACGRLAMASLAACTARERAGCIHNLLIANESYRVFENLIAGRVRIDMAAATTCFSAPPDRFCSTNNIESLDPACGRIFVGTLRLNDPCDVGFGNQRGPCGEGFCPIFPMVCPARCTAYQTVGMPCGETGLSAQVCAPNLICQSGTCRALPARGAACTGSCAEGLVCRVLVDAGGSTCEPPVPSGGACNVPVECVSGLCSGGICRDRAAAMGDRCEIRTQCPAGLGCHDTTPGGVVVSVCVPDLDLGAACDPEASRCGPGLQCSGTGSAARCVYAEPEAGQPCNMGNCASGLACVMGTCQTLAALGARCDATQPFGTCASPGYCGLDGVCRGPAALGGACRPGVESSCELGLFCGADSRCARSLPAGSTCDPMVARACASGLRCVSNRCTAGLPRGAACTSPEACSDGLCIDMRCTGICPRS